MAKYIKQEIADLNGKGETQVYYRMQRNQHFTHEQFMNWMKEIEPAMMRQAEGVIDHMCHQLAILLGKGNSVTIDGLGTFRAAIGLVKGKEMDGLKEGETTRNAQSLTVTDVRFRPEKKLIKDIRWNCTLKRGGVQRIRQQKYTAEERLQRAHAYLDENSMMRVADYMALTGLSRTAATLELQALRSDPSSGITISGRGTHKVYVKRKTETESNG